MTAVQLPALAAPEVIERLAYGEIKAALLADFAAKYPEWTAALESDPVSKLLEVAAYRELLLRHRINQAARANLLAFASGADLDHLALFYGVDRLSGEDDDDAFRLRVRARIIGWSTGGGSASYRYHAMSGHPGIEDAGVWSPNPGEVVVSLLPRPSERPLAIHRSGETRDGLGITTALRLLSVTQGVTVYLPGIDCTLTADTVEWLPERPSPAPGSDYQALVEATESPGELLAAARERVMYPAVRVLTDTIEVRMATQISFSIVARVWLRPQTTATRIGEVETALRAALAAERRLGWDVTRTWIVAQLQRAGVYRVELNSPADDLIVPDDSYPHLDRVTLTLAGHGY
jgi:phage-related baseplate assembly protein